jgi:hypothetical protein
MLGEVTIERCAIGSADPSLGVSDDFAPAAREVAERQRRHLAGDEPGQQADSRRGERRDVARRFGHRAEHRDRPLQIGSSEHCRFPIPAALPGRIRSLAHVRARRET